LHLFLCFVANQFIRQLEDVTITTGQKLILACDLNAECKNVKWYKTNGAIPHYAITTNFKIADSNAEGKTIQCPKVKGQIITINKTSLHRKLKIEDSMGQQVITS
jgi:hypothetical protein